ncbi:MAG: Mov34/MPN/PAD-1 family protein [Planctomycetes bacterium]|nr:Mov34/MPN/PAD-1 family protein [Planctomycetota bacterium]
MTRPAVFVAIDVEVALRDAAAAAWPDEFAGVVGGRRDGDTWHVDAFVGCRADAHMHGFAISAATFAAAEAQLRDLGHRWLGFVHSHPGAAPHPSHEDLATAWPDALQLLLGSATREALALRAFVIRDRVATPLPVGNNAPTTGAPA